MTYRSIGVKVIEIGDRMKDQKNIKTILNLSILLLVFLACSTSGGAGTQIPSTPLNATLNEVQGDVSAKQPAASEYSPAVDGLIIETGGEVQTGDDGRTRVNVS